MASPKKRTRVDARHEISARGSATKRQAKRNGSDIVGDNNSGEGSGSVRSNTRIEKRKLADLIPFPSQATYFDDLSDEDLKRLADDIRRNGLREIIEVLPANAAGFPAGTIVRGHQRKRALVSLGISESLVR